MTAQDDLLASLFDGRDASLRPVFAVWLRDSRRFQTFATTYHGKIRAKLRNARDPEGLRDLGAELEAAALLLREARFALEYEKYSATKQRGPDFTVTYKTHTPFNVEVRRIRDDWTGADEESRVGKLMTILSDKVRQMPPSIINLLWLAAEHDIASDDLIEATTRLRHLAERKTEAFFTRRGFASAADFLRQFARLSGIVWPEAGQISVWPNPIARHPLPPGIAAAIRRLGSDKGQTDQTAFG